MVVPLLILDLRVQRLMSLFFWVFQGTPALFLVLLLCQSSMVGAYVEDQRCVLQTSPGWSTDISVLKAPP